MLHYEAFLYSIFQVMGRTESSTREAEIVNNFIRMVKTNFLTMKQVESAKELCISPNYLNRLIKKKNRLYSKPHTQQQIVWEAKNRLRRQGLH